MGTPAAMGAIPMRLTVAAFAVWIACGVLRFVRPAPLEHDEARYALSVRRVEPRWLYVPRGMTWLGELPFVVGVCR